jgi:hypothetical protein
MPPNGGSVPELTNPPILKAPVRLRQFTPLVLQTSKALVAKAEMYVDPFLSLREFAAAVGSPSYSVIRKWISSGQLRTWRIGKHGHHKVRLSEVCRFIASGEQKS